MGLSMNRAAKLFIILILLPTVAWCEPDDSAPAQILFLMKNGEVERALDKYRENYGGAFDHDHELLQEIGLMILNEGSSSRDPEVQLLTLFGAGISINERAFPILLSGIKSPIPQAQLVALNMLSRFESDDSEEAMQLAMRSDFPLIRLEAAFHLAEKKHPNAISQTEALMYKLPPEAFVLFPQLYAQFSTPTATRLLRQLLNHPLTDVRISSILSVGKCGRDDLLGSVRTLMTQLDIAQQEACATTAGTLKDGQSRGQLRILTRSKSDNVRLAALYALHQIGADDVAEEIVDIARDGNPFAIRVLGKVPGTEGTLYELCQSKNLTVRINAGLALLEHHDPRCLNAIAEVLIHDSRDLAFIPVSTVGKSMTSIKVVPSASQNLKDAAVAYEMSLRLREQTLTDTFQLPLAAYLELARLLFEVGQPELIPTLVHNLETESNSASTALLKQYSVKAGAPLIRNYCNLALYRMKEDGPYKQQLSKWVAAHHHHELIRFRPMLPNQGIDDRHPYHLTPQETSRLLVESFESIAKAQDSHGIDILIEAIRNGNPKNRYALAGLLMHATL
ncbi:MAG: HEAT repeat domain-containing protein [Chlamydiales bacterium]|nr:HEAT repeat domain-containing protein [Chlamydiia bacterium]MCP5508089.1 HEAT repeat domain-containing protein [Chlamydiales bacterium]